MTIRLDPENNETHALFEMVNFSGQHVLEIGCGGGRVTWLYAEKAARVTAIDPSSKQIAHPKGYRYPFQGAITMGSETRARQTFFDGVVERYLADMAQFVVLGAGFDTRAFNLPKDARVHAFEVDAPKTSTAKREVLQKAGIDTTGVTFVAADFQ